MTGRQYDVSKPLDRFVFPWPFPSKPSFFYNLKSCFTMGFVSAVSRILFFRLFNRMIVHNKQRFITALEDKSRPLITMSNHRSNIDDPLLWSEIVFFYRIFSLGRCVPCVRGAGINQEGMNFSKQMLDQNGWVHIFPEGKVTPDPVRFKWGIGRLIMDSKTPPIVLPIWCHNMSSVWPVSPPYYPRFGNTVEVYIGEPIDTKTILSQVAPLKTVPERRKAITDFLQDTLYEMAERLGHLPKGIAKRIHEEQLNNK